ncbi:sulfatase-like hydrolase/transferase [Luteolibacter ambystomatis]|uniref:Sulfatase-like hydrolase/transferase n=1 Tax=Luteolibacter ambystomatis TaxID=2824561 RepID=A0A975PGL5_9BACT|nr:sulfatase-like hydrolase/transferase [Luteolibacter ambystomatis]QUE52422.1 sulfatase-like hydrolase/transferase [Luteolibacter ambystomatis]
MKRFALLLLFALPCLKAAPPNIIILLADDMAQQDLGVFGQKEYATPHLDKLAREGCILSNAYAGAPVCAPSRATLLTGLHTGHARVRALGTRLKGQPAILLKEDTTIAKVLHDTGYRTGVVGKWGLGSNNDEGHPLNLGFDSFYGFETHEQAHDFFPPFLTRDRVREPIPGNAGFDMKRLYRYDSDRSLPQVPKDFWPQYMADGALDLTGLGVKQPDQARYSQDIIQEAALRFINQPDPRPFFLYYATQIPHGPTVVKNLGEFKDKPWDIKHKVWAAMMKTLDDDVGELVAALEKSGKRGNTVIWFASDNGCEPGYLATHLDKDKRGDDPVFHNFGPGRGVKYTHYERGLRVSSFINAPGRIGPGICEQPTENYDLLPTFAAMAGTKLDSKTDGINLMPYLQGVTSDDRILYWEDGANAKGTQAARTGKWFAFREGSGAALQLYDLETDRACSNDLAPKQPEVVGRIDRFLKEQHAPSPWYPSKLDAAP